MSCRWRRLSGRRGRRGAAGQCGERGGQAWSWTRGPEEERDAREGESEDMVGGDGEKEEAGLKTARGGPV